MYLKSRVLQLAPELPFIMADMVQQPFEVYNKNESMREPLKFEQALFLAQAVKKWKIDEKQFTRAERHFYDKGIEALHKFHDLHQLMQQLVELNTNVHYIHWKLTTDTAASNFTSYSQDTTDATTQELSETVAAYNKADAQLAAYPEWQNKLREEIGKYINIVYSAHIENPKLEKLLGGFDRHLYFK